MLVEFSVPALRGKGRPRMTKAGVVYTPAETTAFEELVRAHYLGAVRGRHGPFEGPVSVGVLAYLPIPKSAARAKREAMARGEIRPTSKPDVDNVAKAILDALNGAAYLDDKQVVALRVEKYYSDTGPVCRVRVREVEG